MVTITAAKCLFTFHPKTKLFMVPEEIAEVGVLAENGGLSR
jgi:hypothetical protein